MAAPSPGEASKLGGPELTPVGAERPGNAAGTIPAWTGGISKLPAAYEAGMHHVDPYADDEVLFNITADNIEEHADKLSEGQKALLRLYPSWRMQVYPTRRSASYPEWVYDAVRTNATTASVIIEGKGGVAGSNVSSPFPIPESGVEAVWNHILRWRGIRVSRSFGQAPVTRKGRYTVILALQEWVFPYGDHPESDLRQKFPNILLALKSKIIQPGLVAGDGTLVLEPVNRTRDPRKSWNYNQALRRVLRAPYIANDYPALNADGLRTVDEFDMYNGSPERFEWQLLGKQELYIPYNAYQIDGEGQTASDILQTKHINPDLARYELHRVWVVEGTLKADMKHVYSRRVFYIDEDSWQIAAMDNYDLDGKLWRTAEAHAMNYYEVPVLWSTLEVYYDLQKERYLVSGMDGQRNPYRFSDEADPREFSPNALKYYIR
ncbi:MAG TPA: DUF1329 domain-containing protein [Gammaproteobacteria bacterium]|nr:DUF1329 domain-containing protein [Gammaproteobacteria bacterium]